MLSKLGIVFALLCCASLAAQAQFINLGPTAGNRTVIHFDSTVPQLTFDVTDDSTLDVIFSATGGINFNNALMPAGSAGNNGDILTSLGAGNAPAWADIGSLAWTTSGNSGTDTNNFIGTTDNQALAFRTNDITRARFYGSVGTDDSGAFAPAEHDVYSLGTPTHRWKDLYLGPNSLRIGGFANGAKDGQSPQTIDEATISFENGNLVIDKDVVSEGSVLPNTDGVYDLGSPDSRWADLYLSGNTIHMGSSAAEATMSYDDESHELSFSTDLSDDAEIIMGESDGNGRLGIGASPNTTLDVNGDAAFRFSNLSLNNGANSDVDVGASSAVRITGPTGAFEIHGLAGGEDGKVVELYNASGQTMRLFNQSATETTAGNRISTGTGHSFEVRNLGAVRLVYNTSDNRWIMTSETRNTSNVVYTMKTYAAFTVAQNAWTPDFGYVGHRISANANTSVSGINATGVQDGTMILLINVGATNITLQNDNAGAAIGNRIYTGTGNNETIAPNKPATLVYDATTPAHWRVISGR